MAYYLGQVRFFRLHSFNKRKSRVLDLQLLISILAQNSITPLLFELYVIIQSVHSLVQLNQLVLSPTCSYI